MLVFPSFKVLPASVGALNLGLNRGGASHGTSVPLHLPLLGYASFLFFSSLFFFFPSVVLYYRFILKIIRGVPNKAVEKNNNNNKKQVDIWLCSLCRPADRKIDDTVCPSHPIHPGTSKLCYNQESNVEIFFLFVFNDERTIVYSGLSKNLRLLSDTKSNPPLWKWVWFEWGKKFHFGIKGFALTLVLKQRIEASLEWPIFTAAFLREGLVQWLIL